MVEEQKISLIKSKCQRMDSLNFLLLIKNNLSRHCYPQWGTAADICNRWFQELDNLDIVKKKKKMDTMFLFHISGLKNDSNHRSCGLVVLRVRVLYNTPGEAPVSMWTKLINDSPSVSQQDASCTFLDQQEATGSLLSKDSFGFQSVSQTGPRVDLSQDSQGLPQSQNSQGRLRPSQASQPAKKKSRMGF